MSIHFALHHVTHYRYERAVELGPQIVRLRPAAHSRTRVLSYSLKVLPENHFINWQQDPQGNYLARLVFPQKTDELRIEVDLVAEMAVFNPFDFFLEPYAEKIPFSYAREEHHELLPYLETLPLTPRFQAYLDSIDRAPVPAIDFLVNLNQRLAHDIGYLVRMEPGIQTPEFTLESASGSCRDSAWLLVQLLRHQGMAARFVSGYLVQLKADVEALDGPSGTDVDFTDLHAWCEVYLPGAGWVGLDATSGLFAGEGHIPLACSPEPSSAAPISGLVEPCATEFSHDMSVQRIWEAPRVTKPYTEEQWLDIQALGRQIDSDLNASDVRLTMGGEPTFVFIDDRDGDEWNTAALGPGKRRLSAELYQRMRAHYAPHGLVHFGQGKWYPGEQLPRWSLNCFWRRDGQPVWRNNALIADESQDYGTDGEMAGRFLSGVAQRLKLPACDEPRTELEDPNAERTSANDESADWLTRTALSAEVREGRLYLFMPPLQSLEAYLELVTAIEATAGELQCPVLLEGSEPPRDPRLANFRITPDTEVIKVNVQPSSSWDELVEHTEFLYEQARLTRLTTEKFMIDGRHTGTGGGNHFVLGGATPADSPFLRRPDLLRSLLGYWHNHPSLSYLFSGLFIGPTSQAPRVDETRNDALYELEIAFAQMPAPGEECPPWWVDRLLRNLLIDVTGNTHRAEFCIDKLYSPDGATGRLGLLELRAFEMPPHARMSLAQQLLLRALVARFWRAPYAPAKLARWGTQLHDRFMLPHFIEQDFADVIEELNSAGYPLRPEWFAAHLEFRFPKVGDYAVSGIELELRQALEPWHVLGEEGAAGAVRYVDSSLERLQLKVTGLPPQRYMLTCNGVPVPLQPTGRVGEFVAGVRYRAWQPFNALQPTIAVHAPLVFDILDTWMQRSLGGCEYHVAHPGGRNYEHLPVNANEAESRRLSRFFRIGHTPGTLAVPALTINDELPMTLDLRLHR